MNPRFLVMALLGLAACSSKDMSRDGDSRSSTPDASSPDAQGAPGDDSGVAGCGLHTGYPGDDACILPPPPDKGFQVHIGPSDYDNPDSTYVLLPGDELTTDFPAVAGNDQDVFFYYRQYRMRPTAHHVILTTPNENGTAFDLGRRIGTANTSQDSPVGGITAPENEGVGMPLAAHSPINVSLHAINSTDAPGLREVWVNFWYKDAALVNQPAEEWFKVGSATFAIQPHTEQTLGPYTCDVAQEGRLLWLYGHRHANNVRFTATRIRGQQRDVIYDADRWEEPLLLEYNSLVHNSAPDIPHGVEGGWSGVLDLLPGDKVEWSCDVVNNRDTVLRFTNQTFLGEMCIVDAEAVGTPCNGL